MFLILEEISKAAEEAHKLGLTYAGWNKWKNAAGIETHKTVNDKLVRIPQKVEKFDSKEAAKSHLEKDGWKDAGYNKFVKNGKTVKVDKTGHIIEVHGDMPVKNEENGKINEPVSSKFASKEIAKEHLEKNGWSYEGYNKYSKDGRTVKVDKTGLIINVSGDITTLSKEEVKEEPKKEIKIEDIIDVSKYKVFPESTFAYQKSDFSFAKEVAPNIYESNNGDYFVHLPSGKYIQYTKKLKNTQSSDETTEKEIHNSENESKHDKENQKELEKTGFWGKAGAGALIFAKSSGRFLINHRGKKVEQPGTWGVWGGAIDGNMSPEASVRKEVREESGYTGKLELIPAAIYNDPEGSGFKYYNFIGLVDEEFTPKLDWESQGYAWRTLDNFPEPLHFGLKYLMDHTNLQGIVDKYSKKEDSFILKDEKEKEILKDYKLKFTSTSKGYTNKTFPDYERLGENIFKTQKNGSIYVINPDTTYSVYELKTPVKSSDTPSIDMSKYQYEGTNNGKKHTDKSLDELYSQDAYKHVKKIDSNTWYNTNSDIVIKLNKDGYLEFWHSKAKVAQKQKEDAEFHEKVKSKNLPQPEGIENESVSVSSYKKTTAELDKIYANHIEIKKVSENLWQNVKTGKFIFINSEGYVSSYTKSNKNTSVNKESRKPVNVDMSHYKLIDKSSFTTTESKLDDMYKNEKYIEKLGKNTWKDKYDNQIYYLNDEGYLERYGYVEYIDKNKYITNDNISLAKQKNISNLSHMEVASIITYTSGTYVEINKELRKNNTVQNKDIYEFTSLAKKALKKLPNYVGEVYRWTRIPNNITFEKGSVFMDYAFFSSSKDPSLNFASMSHSEPGLTNTKFVIKSKKGKDISKISKHSHEDEVLFKPETPFKVTKIKIENNIRIVHLEEL